MQSCYDADVGGYCKKLTLRIAGRIKRDIIPTELRIRNLRRLQKEINALLQYRVTSN